MTVDPPSESRRSEDGEAHPPFGRPSITVTLTSAIALLVVIAVGTVWGIGVLANLRNTLDLLNAQARLIIDTIEFGVHDHLNPAVEQLEFLARRIEGGDVNPTDKGRMHDLLAGALAAAPQIERVVFWDPDLHQVGAVAGPDGTLTLLDRDQSGNELVETLVSESIEADAAFWGDPVFAAGTTFINFRRPLRREGVYIGVLASAVVMPELSAFLSTVGDMFDGTATAFILHGRDHVLGHPHLVSPHPDLSEATPVVERTRIGDLVLDSLGTGRTPRGFEELIAAGYEVEVVDVANYSYLVLYRWVNEFGATPWALGTYFLSTDFAEEARRLILSALIGFVVLVVAIAAAIVQGRLLARPIRRAALAARRIGSLDLRDVEPLARSSIREIDDQATAFNTMVEALRWFAIYVPRSLVMRLIQSGVSESMQSVERELTIMFTDLVGFTAQSERMPASETEALLNHHFAILGAAVEAEGGTIDKYIGDALMAFWGAPDVQADHAARACRAARAIMAAITEDNAAREAAGKPPIRMRIGVHSGPVVVGNIGAPGRMNYTVVGDAVNAAQRMESLGKELGRGDAVTALVSGVTVAQLDDRAGLEAAGAFEVKGRTEPLEVFRLVPDAP